MAIFSSRARKWTKLEWYDSSTFTSVTVLTLILYRERKPYPPLDPPYRTRSIWFHGHGRRWRPPEPGTHDPCLSSHQNMVSSVPEEYAMAIYQSSRGKLEAVFGYASGLILCVYSIGLSLNQFSLMYCWHESHPWSLLNLIQGSVSQNGHSATGRCAIDAALILPTASGRAENAGINTYVLCG